MKMFLAKSSDILKMSLKLFVALAILYWLISNNKLDFRLVIESFRHPSYFIIGLILFSLQIILGAVRWRTILQTKTHDLPLIDVLRIQWIGQFFSMVLPGAVTGDLVKIGYLSSYLKHHCKDHQISKNFLFLSIFIDRLTGLLSLLFMAGISSLFFHQKLIALNPILEKVMQVNFLLLGLSCLLVTSFYLPKKLQFFIKKCLPFEFLKNSLDTLWEVGSYKKSLVLVIFLGLIGHLFSAAAFWIINTPFFESPIRPEYLLSLLPLAQVAIAVPISPAGLGVGHAAYERIFHFIGHSNGASLFNVYWVGMFLINILGLFPFILSKKKQSDKNPEGELAS